MDDIDESELDETAARRLHEHSPERIRGILSDDEVAAEHEQRRSARRSWTFQLRRGVALLAAVFGVYFGFERLVGCVSGIIPWGRIELTVTDPSIWLHEEIVVVATNRGNVAGSLRRSGRLSVGIREGNVEFVGETYSLAPNQSVEYRLRGSYLSPDLYGDCGLRYWVRFAADDGVWQPRVPLEFRCWRGKDERP